MTKTCPHGNQVRPHSQFTSDQCRACWIVEHSKAKPDYNPDLSSQKKTFPCLHLGKRVEHVPGECQQKCKYECEAGRGLVRPAFECKDCKAEPGSPYEPDDPNAGLELKVPSVPREQFSPIKKRNLVFHLYPAPQAWQWHAHRLLTRVHLFNGRKIMAIVTGDNLDHPDTVRSAFPGFEFIEIPNDPKLREVATFEPMFRLLTDDPDEATLYAHSKAVTRLPVETSRRWAEVLYETCFDYWPHVDKVLSTFPIAGPFLKVGPGWKSNESDSGWHYSGSFWWFRNRKLFSKPDWKRIDRFWCGIESYPSLHFDLNDAGELFHRSTVRQMNLYKWVYWNTVIEPQLTVWQRLHDGERTKVPA